VKHPQGIEVDEYGFTIVDLRNVGHKDEPWGNKIHLLGIIKSQI
jgi:hypothetical protein